MEPVNPAPSIHALAPRAVRSHMSCYSTLLGCSRLPVLCFAGCQGGAHFFELANKMSLSPDEYMTVQKIYAGWSLFAPSRR
jgi:hypothetical protein